MFQARLPLSPPLPLWVGWVGAKILNVINFVVATSLQCYFFFDNFVVVTSLHNCSVAVLGSSFETKVAIMRKISV